MTRRWRTLAVLVVVALVVGALGLVAARTLRDEDPYAGYCEEVRRQQQPLSETLAGEPRTALIEAMPSLEALAERSPADVRADWRTVVEAVRGLRQALEDAGVDPATYDPAHPPPGVDAQQQQAIAAAASRLASIPTRTAWARVQQQVRDVCHTPLTL